MPAIPKRVEDRLAAGVKKYQPSSRWRGMVRFSERWQAVTALQWHQEGR